MFEGVLFFAFWKSEGCLNLHPRFSSKGAQAEKGFDKVISKLYIWEFMEGSPTPAALCAEFGVPSLELP